MVLAADFIRAAADGSVDWARAVAGDCACDDCWLSVPESKIRDTTDDNCLVSDGYWLGVRNYA